MTWYVLPLLLVLFGFWVAYGICTYDFWEDGDP